MRFFKRKPKPDVMGFLCCETTRQRMMKINELLGSDRLRVQVYAFSTGVIQCILDQQYTDEVIQKTMMYCDKFMIKKHQDFSQYDVTIQQVRQRIQEYDLKDDEAIQQLVDKVMEDWQVVSPALHDELIFWCHTQLLISDDIKSK